MKRSTKLFLSTAAVLFVAACVQKETIRKQKKARKEGRHVPYGPYEALFKRPLDLLITGMAFAPLAPVMGITALLIKVKLGSPVIFKQERPGKDEKIFTLYKFRTMTDEKDENGELLPDGERLTGFGKLLRSTSLDELPELFNILKGDMSLVGPRPLATVYLPYYTDKERHRHDVRPGLTGKAQANGRNSLSWEDKFTYDVAYVGQITLANDLKILLQTIKQVVCRDGIGQAEQAPVSLHVERGKKNMEILE